MRDEKYFLIFPARLWEQDQQEEIEAEVLAQLRVAG